MSSCDTIVLLAVVTRFNFGQNIEETDGIDFSPFTGYGRRLSSPISRMNQKSAHSNLAIIIDWILLDD